MSSLEILFPKKDQTYLGNLSFLFVAISIVLPKFKKIIIHPTNSTAYSYNHF